MLEEYIRNGKSYPIITERQSKIIHRLTNNYTWTPVNDIQSVYIPMSHMLIVRYADQRTSTLMPGLNTPDIRANLLVDTHMEIVSVKSTPIMSFDEYVLKYECETNDSALCRQLEERRAVKNINRVYQTNAQNGDISTELVVIIVIIVVTLCLTLTYMIYKLKFK
jgi:hypothetical protein